MFLILQHPSKSFWALPAGPGQVEFKDVSFNYSNGNTLLNHMNVTFEGGMTTALVGPSGGGKSTIINLILRLYDPIEGSNRLTVVI